jgi:hypothetical protein
MTKLSLEQKVAALRELAKQLPNEDEDYFWIDGVLYGIEYDEKEGLYSVEGGGSETRDPYTIGIINLNSGTVEVWTKEGWDSYPLEEPTTSQTAHNN